MMIKQLPLSVQLRDDATFENFYPGDNQQVLFSLENFLNTPNEKFIYLWGNRGCGKTHLLQACCHQAQQSNVSAIYLPLSEVSKLSPALLENIENLALICIDELEVIAGNAAWEEALFHCYNRLLTTTTKLIVAANSPSKLLSFKLPDLISRLSASIIFQVQPLSDEQKIAALQLRAKIRGMELSENVANFLLNHYQRDSQQLFSSIDQLDRASLAAKRKLTIPFIKDVLS